MNLSAIILVTKLLYVCVTLVKPISPTFVYVQANPVGGSSHPPRPEWWPLTEYWPPTAQEYGGDYITPDDIYREINTVFRNGDGWPICTGMQIQVTRCATINLINTLIIPFAPEHLGRIIPIRGTYMPNGTERARPTSSITPFLRPCDACQKRKNNNRCVWARSACKFQRPSQYTIIPTPVEKPSRTPWKPKVIQLTQG